jgi:hypothetical protein
MKTNKPLQRKTPLTSKVMPRRQVEMKKRPSPSSKTPAAKSARAEDCTLRLPGCVNATETVVLCHLPGYGGSGMGTKPDDTEAVYGCAHCHDIRDGRVPSNITNFGSYDAWALIRTHRRMRATGVLVFKGES